MLPVRFPGQVTMEEQSVVLRTGQAWKLAIAVLALLVGSVAPLWPETTHLGWTGGTILACAGYAFGLVAVRCPDCGSRWFWKAALDAGLYGPLFRRSACPDCGKDFGKAP